MKLLSLNLYQKFFIVYSPLSDFVYYMSKQNDAQRQGIYEGWEIAFHPLITDAD